MAFESLSDKLTATFKRLRGKGRLRESDIKEAMRDVRIALLEADVSYKVVKDFIKTVSERANGTDVLESLTGPQMVIKIVREELTSLMGAQNAKITMAGSPPTVVMMVGLQGAGKTTNCAKLAGLLKRQNGKRPLLVACDIYRPAAIRQLETVGAQLGLPVFQMGQANPVDIARAAVSHAKKHGNDIIFLDTAGRLHIDDALMAELQNIRQTVKPDEIILVVDAMTGQDAVTAAEGFHAALGVDGILLTKTDGDARGGAALSVKAVTGRPIKFIGTGEKLEDIEAFHPDRIASRILGMGDVLSIIEKAEEAMDAKKAEEMVERLKKNQFTLNDFYDQLEQFKRMGGLSMLEGKLPGMNKSAMQNAAASETALLKTGAIIQSMTPFERENPSCLGASRKKRIAVGAGVPVLEINRLMKQYTTMQNLVKQMSGGKMSKKLGRRAGFMQGLEGLLD